MSTKSWGIYDIKTGLFRCRYSGPEHTIDEQLRDGEAFIEGEIDTALQRIDPESGKLVPLLPPSPGPDYEWSEGGRRWDLKPAAAAREQARTAALERIAELEAQQARPIREFLLGVPGALQKLDAIEAAIVDERAILARFPNVESTF